jgi:hypothetical protein
MNRNQTRPTNTARQNYNSLISKLKENPNIARHVAHVGGFHPNTEKKQSLEKARKLCYNTYDTYKRNNYKIRLNAITEVLRTGFSEEVAKRITNYLDMAVFTRRYSVGIRDRPLTNARRYFSRKKTKPFSVYSRRMQDIMNVAHNEDERKRLIVFFKNTENYLDSRYRTNQNSIRQRGETQNRSSSSTYQKTNSEKKINNALRCPQATLRTNMKMKYPKFNNGLNTQLRNQPYNRRNQVIAAQKGKGKMVKPNV